MITRAAAVVVAACLLLAGCAAPGSPRSPVHGGIAGDWELVEATVGGAPLSFPAHGRGTLSADGRRLTGSAFCNGFGGTYRLDGDRLVVADLASTAMGCTDQEQTAAESAYLRVLAAGDTRVTRTEDGLVLENPAGRLHFRAESPVPIAALVGTPWVLESLVDGLTASSTTGDPATLQLAGDGGFTASTGCRALSGRWAATGDTVVVSGMRVDGECPVAAQRQDEHVLAVLGSAFRTTVEGNRLTITGDGRGLVYRTGR